MKDRCGSTLEPINGSTQPQLSDTSAAHFPAVDDPLPTPRMLMARCLLLARTTFNLD